MPERKPPKVLAASAAEFGPAVLRGPISDHQVIDQSSILRFIEDNWKLGRIGGGSSDAIAESIMGMFDFDQDSESVGSSKLILDPNTGKVVPD